MLLIFCCESVINSKGSHKSLIWDCSGGQACDKVASSFKLFTSKYLHTTGRVRKVDLLLILLRLAVIISPDSSYETGDQNNNQDEVGGRHFEKYSELEKSGLGELRIWIEYELYYISGCKCGKYEKFAFMIMSSKDFLALYYAREAIWTRHQLMHCKISLSKGASRKLVGVIRDVVQLMNLSLFCDELCTLCNLCQKEVMLYRAASFHPFPYDDFG